MSYAVQSDLVLRFGDREIIAATDRGNLGFIDAAVLSAAIDEAGVEIDGYLSGRYPLPLPSVPRLLTGICCDIARYRLSGADVQETEAIRNRYKDAVKMLVAIRDGKLSLGLDASNQPPATGDTVKINNGVRKINADSLADY